MSVSAMGAPHTQTGEGQTRRAWWRRVGHPLRHATLRTKLVLAVVALVAALGVVVSLVSALFLSAYMVSQLDDQLRQQLHRGEAIIVGASTQLGNVPVEELLGTVVRSPGINVGTVAAITTSSGQTYSYYLNPSDPSAARLTLSGSANQRIAGVVSDTQPVDVDLGGSVGMYRMMAQPLSSDAELVIGVSLSGVQATTGRLVTIVLLVTLVGVAVAAVLGLLIVYLSLRPLDRVAATATAVTKLPLDKGDVVLRIRVADEDADPHTEVGRLVAAFNHMLGHVASALTARQVSENKVRQFVADASHELRTPLASIRGYAELTRRTPEPLPDDAVYSLGRIESEAARMTGLVEDLLLLARLDEGRELDREPVDLSRLVIDAVSDAHAAGPGHLWSMDLPPEPVTVLGDGPRLYEVIANLLTNARVHTPEGTSVVAEVRIDRDPAGGGAPQAVVTVTDDGPGIPDDLQSTLFERFARGDSSRSRHTGSTGLGLAIVRAVALAQGGSVEVESEPGRTCFTVRLPLDESAPAAEDAPEIDPADSGLDATEAEPDATEADLDATEAAPGPTDSEPPTDNGRGAKG